MHIKINRNLKCELCIYRVRLSIRPKIWIKSNWICRRTNCWLSDRQLSLAKMQYCQLQWSKIIGIFLFSMFFGAGWNFTRSFRLTMRVWRIGVNISLASFTPHRIELIRFSHSVVQGGCLSISSYGCCCFCTWIRQCGALLLTCQLIVHVILGYNNAVTCCEKVVERKANWISAAFKLNGDGNGFWRC